MSIPLPPPPVAGQDKASNQAITALIVAVVGFLTVGCCGLGALISPIGWYLAQQELKRIAAGQAPAAGQGMAQVGKIFGMIGTVLGILMLVWVFVMGGLAFFQAMMANAGS